MSQAEPEAGAFSEVRILDLSRRVVGPYATKLLADLGADVVKVEPLGGDPGRRLWPNKDDRPGENASGTFAFLNTNKRSICLDLRAAGDREAVQGLVAWADIVVEDFAPGKAAGAGFDLPALRRINPALSVVSISDFGRSGPYARWKGSDLVLYAMGGEMHSAGLANREPLKMPGFAALMQAGATASDAIAALAFGRARGLPPQHVEIAVFEALLASPDRRHAIVLAYQFSGRLQSRQAGSEVSGFAGGLLPCADGYVELSIRSGDFPRLRQLLGNPETLAGNEFETPMAPANPELKERVDSVLFPWLLARTKREVWAEAQASHIIASPLNSAADLHHDPVLRERGFFEELHDDERGSYLLPGRPFVLAQGGWQLRRAAPRLDEHRAEILELRARPDADPAPRPPAVRLPLEGIRVLDLGVLWAGPFGAMLLADLGAEVIKVENHRRPAPMVRAIYARPSAQLVRAMPPLTGGYPKEAQIVRPWNTSPTFTQSFRNKRSVTIDHRTPEGRRALEALVRASDVFIENNVPETLERLGMTYETLRTWNPELVFVSAPGFGLSGPYRNFRAQGNHIEAFTSYAELRHYRDTDASTNTASFAADAFLATHIALATIAALEQRRRTGQGQLVELALAETSLSMVAGHLMDYALNGRVEGTIANRDVFGAAPSGVFRTVGEDRWLALTVCDDRQWQALGEVLGNPSWAKDEKLATAEGRRSHQDEIEAALSAELAPRDANALAASLQERGVPAGPVLDARDVLHDPQIRARGMLVPVDHPDAGRFEMIGPPWRFDVAPVTVRRRPVTLGEDNEYVYRELMGYTDEEYAALVRSGDVATEFDASVP